MASVQVDPAGTLQMENGHVEAKPVVEGMSPKLHFADRSMRTVTIVATLAATVVMGLAKETKMVQMKLDPTLPPVSVRLVAKSTYSSATIFFIIANAIACAYTLFSLVVPSSLKKRRNLSTALAIADLMMLGLLFSGNGAQATIGVLSLHGNRHMGWNKFCNVLAKFCNMGTVAFNFSMFAATNYLIIIALSTWDLRRRSQL